MLLHNRWLCAECIEAIVRFAASCAFTTDVILLGQQTQSQDITSLSYNEIRFRLTY